MKKVVLLIFAIVTYSANAQMMVGPKLGVNFSTLKGSENSSSQTGAVAGASISFKVVDFLAISADVLYSAEGGKYSWTFNNYTVDLNTRLNYLRVPVLANFYFGREDAPVRPKIMLGPDIGFLLNAKSEAESSGFSAEIGLDESDFSSTDFGAIAGLGADFRLTDKMFMNLEGRYYFGASDIIDSDLPNVEEVKNNSASVTLGLTFIIGE